MLKVLHRNVALREDAPHTVHSTLNGIRDLGTDLLSLLAQDKLRDPTRMSAALVNATNLNRRLGRNENSITGIIEELEILENLGLVRPETIENTNKAGYQFLRYRITDEGVEKLKELRPEVIQNTKPIVTPFLDSPPSYL